MEHKSYLGINIKKNANLGNLMSIPFCYMINTTCGAYMNAAIVFLLRNDAYYQVEDIEVGAISSSILFWSMFFSILVSPLFGYSYELLGRRFTLGLAFGLQATMLFLVPFCSPSV